MAAEYDLDSSDKFFPFARHERNGSFASVQRIDLDRFTIGARTDPGDPAAPTVSINGQIDIKSDVDVYSFEVLQNDLGYVTLTFDVDYAAASGLDTQIQLFDANGAFIQDNDDSTTLDQ